MKTPTLFLHLLVVVGILAGCVKTTPTPEVLSPTEVVELPTPTATQPPMALLVNGSGITLEEYESDLNRLQMALSELGQEMTSEEQKERVLNNFTEELLFAQAALEAGFSVSDEELQERINSLAEQAGGVEKMQEWQVTYGFTDQTFEDYLKRSILAAWQRDQIAEAVPQTAEQVHARQLIYQEEANAVDALGKLQSGTEFSYFAKIQDPVLQGDLGWFPRGVLTQIEVEEAVFSLQPGEISGVIASDIGYHILEVIERDRQHPLSVDSRRTLQQIAIADWLAARRAASTIEVLVP